jgi:TM2 domain-containing membrane protein YozV
MSELASRRPAVPLKTPNRLLANRRIWKDAIYALALLTYVCSFLFFGLGVAQFRGRSISTAVLYILVAIYFLIQVIFLFILSWVVERRRNTIKIDFADRRNQR